MSSGRLCLPSLDPHRRRLAALGVPILLSLALAGCGGGSSAIVTAAPAQQQPLDSTTTANALTLAGQWPLTGQPLDGDLPSHPVYVVKMDNTSSSAPQVGLGSADMVVEELVEGGLTRLAVFFYSNTPDEVGPVRSMRASDVGIAKPAAATIVASGGANPTVRLLTADHVSTLTEDASAAGFYRDDSRAAPYNLFTKLSGLAAKPGGSWTPPTASYLPFGDASDMTGSVSVTSIAATFSGSHTTTWHHTGAGWVRSDSFAQSGDDFVADNVLLLRVKIGDAGYLDPAGNSVPETQFYGNGQAILVHGDSALTCVWHKKDKASPLTLSTHGGTEVTVPAGHTWVELVPSATGSVILGR